MKRKILIDLFEKNGWTLKRHGAGHDIYVKGSERETVPRHSDIDEMLENQGLMKLSKEIE